MSANIFIIFPGEVQCSSMAQRVAHRLSYLFIYLPPPSHPPAFLEHFKQKSLWRANLELRTPLQIGGLESRRETNNMGTKEKQGCTAAEW